MALKVRTVDMAARDYEEITIDATAGGKGVTVAKLGQGAMITVEADQIRYTMHSGGVPTATSGHLLEVGSTLYISDPTSLKNLKMIRVTTDATIRVTHF